MKTKLVIFIFVTAVMIGIVVYIYRGAQKRRATLPQTLEPDPNQPFASVASFAGGGGGIGGGNSNGFVITGVGQIVTNLAVPQTVLAPARVVNLLATPAGTYSGTAKLINPSGVTVHTEAITNLNISASGPGAYPAIYFNPKNPVWGVTSVGIYTMEVRLTIAGVVYTATTPITITGADLTEGLVITGVGQEVTGLNPTQSVTAPARVINLQATPQGTYSGTAKLKNAAGTVLHTELLTNLNISSSGVGAYPAVYFNPQNPVWGVTVAGNYTMEVTFNINGSNYTASTPIMISSPDLGTIDEGDPDPVTPLVDEPADPNPDVEMTVSPYSIKGMFKLPGCSGTYNVTVKLSGTTISTGTAVYGTYAEHTLKRFYNQSDLAGRTLLWQFEKGGVTTDVAFFTPEIVHREYTPVIPVALSDHFCSRKLSK